MKRFFIDFLIAFLIIILVFGASENTQDNIINENYESEIMDDNDNIENRYSKATAKLLVSIKYCH